MTTLATKVFSLGLPTAGVAGTGYFLCWSSNRCSLDRRGLGVRVSKIWKISKILQIFGGLVLGCIETKFCKKICVRQHFSSTNRFASFLHRCNLKIFAKNRVEKSAIFVKFQQKNCKCRKNCKILSNFKNFSLIIW